MGQSCSRTDFDWVYTEEPHATRRKQILAKYPEVRQLMKPDPWFKWQVTFLVCFQLISAWYVRHLSFPVLLVLAYFIGGVVNHALSLAIHEIAHNQAFGNARPLINRAFGIFANLPLCMPTSITFKKYHLLHHRYQGDQQLDVDLPSELEGRLFKTPLTKLIWLIFQPIAYSFRPLIVLPMKPTNLEIINIIVQLTFDLLLLKFCGFRSIFYLVAGTLLSMGVHPVAGHFISEHYIFNKGQETYSYYNILNYLTFNVGYHVEHHDFPSIPGSKLPLLKKMAPEFYDNLYCHNSWVRCLWEFVWNAEIGPHARIKRTNTSTNGPVPESSKSDLANGVNQNSE